MKHSPNTLRSRYHSRLGSMTLAASNSQLVGVWFDGQKHQPDPGAWPTSSSDPILQACAEQLDEYFGGARSRFDLPLQLDLGTAFQQQVWRALLSIPSGTTVSYRKLSQGIGKPLAVRAVASAVGRNPFSILVPCHRVLGSDGSLTGYAGGLDRKRELLLHEDALKQ
ncbi:methylated-DNA--[protein]-cysteine S-methyltransferase [Rhodoferax aquaticus]|uniref:Methylated-DNA--protein-cysteine methyltransferase n=1 Tax=Rhodoferax aquaticus TaxID=2527691 RepID=A0A515EMJ8_9BURK|nr:methylated-DNA--[protein]-cysteine S-methyltransferase [Rhodoferax aquaticus]QDL53879.1 methylated-DNA--[protein]-cysteine S-methyltransferase [Rhodoferax aquaticus]